MAHLLQGANNTAQWYQPLYPEAEVFTHLDKYVLHTTETKSWPSYSNGASAPNVTYHPLLRQVRQHFYSDRSARALQDPTSTPVRENRDNVFQVEIVCFSDKAAGDAVGGLWVGNLKPEHFVDLAAMIKELHNELDLPIQQSVEWHEGRTTAYNDVRLTSSEFDAYKGILGHVHVSGNSHWDPGGFYISRLMAILEDDMTCPLTLSEMQATAREVWDFNTEDKLRDDVPRIPDGTPRDTNALLQALRTQVAQLRDDVDSLALAGPVVDYDLIASKVVEKFKTDLELAFRPMTP